MMIKKNIVHFIYMTVILLIMIVPVLMTNNEPEKRSFIDNAFLPEFPDMSEGGYVQGKLENYLNKRIGFREQAVYLYETGVSRLFNKLEHNLYAYGKNGYIMGNMEEYIKDYQHLNLNQDAEFVDSFALWLSNANKYLKENDIEFLYFLAPDKKTIYHEYVSDTINVLGDVSRTDMLLGRIEELEVPYIYPKNEFLKAKEGQQIYNVKYDALHWNDLGNFLGNKIIDHYMQTLPYEITPLGEQQYELSYAHVDKLMASCFYIYEDTPYYSLKEEEGICDISADDEFKKEIDGDFEHYINENLTDAPFILILHDSYFVDSAKYYKGRYREVVSIHNSNYWKLQEVIEHYQPDIVLFENVERVIAGDFFSVDKLKEWQASPLADREKTGF